MRVRKEVSDRKTRLIISAMLIIAVMFYSLAAVSYADSDITASSDASSVFLSTRGSVFSLSIPTKLSFSPKDEGGAYCASDVAFTSYSSGGADIKSVELSVPDGWTLRSEDDLTSSAPDRCASFRFQGTAIPENGKADIKEMNHIEGKGDTPVFYSVTTSNPKSDLYGVLCADATIVVGWNMNY